MGTGHSDPPLRPPESGTSLSRAEPTFPAPGGRKTLSQAETGIQGPRALLRAFTH